MCKNYLYSMPFLLFLSAIQAKCMQMEFIETEEVLEYVFAGVFFE